MAQLKPQAHEAAQQAARRGTLMTEGTSGTVLVNRLYERKPWWLVAQAVIDSGAWILSVIFAFMLRYSVLLINNGSVFDIIHPMALMMAATGAVVLQLLFGILGVKIYTGVYSYGSFDESWRAAAATLSTGIVLTIFSFVDEVVGLEHIPHSVPAIAAAFSLIMMAGARMAKRVYTERGVIRELTGEPVIVYGAGFIGGMVMDSMLHDEDAKLRPVAVFDDDPLKDGTKFHGISVITTYPTLERVIRESGTRKIIVTIADMPEAHFEAFCERMRGLKVEVQRISSANARLMGERLVTASDNDLMRVIRGEINYDIDRSILSSYLKGKRVLVTGAGGSIGSELCRQISEFEPETLMMLDRDETLLMEAKLSITHESSLDDDRIILADIREGDTLLEIFAERRPEVVFHAAALKHVSALEAYPQEAWKTNSLGTLNVLRAAESVGVKTFVNVSTDKAADPKTALGQSKRVAERLTAYFGEKTGNTYVSVRFGNVFGSRGSIKPLFTKQILSSGPITLTDKRATRYFMLIADACLLVMLAGAIGRPGEVMVLDMGQPVKILDVAKAMREAYERYDVEIKEIGLRKGEKLDETLFGGTEKLVPSEENRYIARSSAPALNPQDLDYNLWIQNYREHSGYERHGLERAPDPRTLAGAQTF